VRALQSPAHEEQRRLVISLLVPTRNRPVGVTRMWTSALATADRPDQVQACFYVDDDDPAGLAAVEALDGNVKVTVGPRRVLSEYWNEAFALADGDICMHASDDIVFRTDSWDTSVAEAFDAISDRIAFVHGRDGFQDANLGTHGFLHRRWVDTVGYFVPPHFSSDMNDLWLTEVADAIGRRVYLPEILTEHMHPVVGKGDLDQTHRERLARHQRDRPERIYRRLASERAADAAKLRQAITAHASPQPTSAGGAASNGRRRVKTPGEAETAIQRPVWSILIASVGVRNADLERLLAGLAPQIDAEDGRVEVVVYWDNFESTLGRVRQALMDDARGEYVSFVDDDDEVPDYHVAKVLAALERGVDYVGWRQQLYVDGVATKPTFHSLRYDRWWEDAEGYYRHVSHLNPIRARLARLGRFDRQVPEDVDWAEQVHAHLAACRNVTEAFIDDVMYLYRYDPEASLWATPQAKGGDFARPVLPSKWMRFHEGSSAGVERAEVPA
jgi:glycosyltransferase involved in cell wall biosynthesis